jgi:hypothetical protein
MTKINKERQNLTSCGLWVTATQVRESQREIGLGESFFSLSCPEIG